MEKHEEQGESNDCVGVVVRQVEDFSLKIKRYKVNGNPTCATNFVTGDVCIFYRTQMFGCSETCVFAKSGGNIGFTETLVRSNKGAGHLIPLSYCPVWNG